MVKSEGKPEVLTTEEAAEFLRVPSTIVLSYAIRSDLPARQLGSEWRFSRRALEDWLRGPSGKRILLSQAGAFSDEPDDLTELRASIYKHRGRPETEERE